MQIIEQFIGQIESVPPRKWAPIWKRLVQDFSAHGTFGGAFPAAGLVWATFDGDPETSHIVGTPGLSSFDNRIPKAKRLQFRPLCAIKRGFWKDGFDKYWSTYVPRVGELPVQISAIPGVLNYCSNCLAELNAENNDGWLADQLQSSDLLVSNGSRVWMGDFQSFEYQTQDCPDSNLFFNCVADTFRESTFRILHVISPRFGFEWARQNQELVSSLQRRIAPTLNTESVCEVCGQVFLPLESAWGGSKPNILQLQRLGFDLLCPKCQSEANGFDYSKPHSSPGAIKALRDFQVSFGFLPAPDWATIPILHGFQGAIQDQQELLVTRLNLLRQMPIPGSKYLAALKGPKYQPARGSLRDQFNDTEWMLLLGAAGLVQGVQRTSFGVSVFGQDGHLCRSLLEYEFCNLLSRLRIKHDPEPPYNDGTSRRADFLVLGRYVEIAGMLSKPEYKEKIISKIKDSNRAGRELRVLKPADVRRICGMPSLTASNLESEIDLASFVNVSEILKLKSDLP